MADYSRILIIKPGAIGDLLQLTPAIRALKGRFPTARITLLVGSEATASLFGHNPHVDATVVFDRRGEHRSLAARFRLWQRLRADHYDLVVNYQRSNLKAWLLASAAFPCRVLVYNKARGRIIHAVANHLETLAPLGIVDTSPELDLFPGEEAESAAASLFAAHGLAGGKVVALNPGASHPVNRWGTRQFARLADLLAEKLACKVIIVGGRDDETLAAEIRAASAARPLVLAGRTDLLQLGAILKRCAVLVSGDTGPMHMATAVGTRVVALFGAADPARTGPVGSGHRVVQAAAVACVPCRSRRCTNACYLECMEMLTPESVFGEVAALMEGEGRR